MASPKGYSSYHGRKAAGKIILAIVLILVILAAAGFLLLQKYLVYDDTGTPHLQLPESSAVSSAPAAAASSSAAGSTGDKSLNITIDEPAKPEAAETQGVQLSSSPSAWASELASLSAEKNAVCVTMRAAGGVLQYTSASAGAVAGSVTASSAASADSALSAVLASDFRHIARLSCLRDSSAARANVESMGLKNTGGFIFYDGNNESWLDPSKPATTAYLCNLAKECAALGFEEILLTDLTYPTVGKLDKINYNGADRVQTLCALVTAVKAAVGDDAEVSVELPESVVLSGSDSTAGLDLVEMLSAASCIYAPLSAQQLDQVPDTLWEAGFVPELSGKPGSIAGKPMLLLPS